MLRYCFNAAVSVFGIISLSWLMLLIAVVVFLYDRSNPLYLSTRIGKDAKPFRLYKFRTMVVNADSSKVDSTAADDPRITPIGYFLRKYKLDELPQLLNVLFGDLSLVGPRPNVERETAQYTQEEKKQLKVLPGITDFSSIIFSDLEEILRGSTNPDLDYNQLVRPYKSRLALFYIGKSSISLDIWIILLTILNCFSRTSALFLSAKTLSALGADDLLLKVATRNSMLKPCPPPGASSVVQGRMI